MVRQDFRQADQDKKLFIGGLNPKTDEDTLKSFYGQWGEIVDVVVMKDSQSGRSRGFGFITYQNSSSVDLAQSNRPHSLDGKNVDSKRAMPREESNPEAHVAVTKVFVGGLRKDVSTEILRDYFTNFGSVTDCSVVMAKDTGESRGFGFVTFDDTDAVDKVILGRPHTIHGSNADVKKALSKDEMRGMKPKPARGGFGGGGYGNMGGGGGGYGQQQQQSWDNSASTNYGGGFAGNQGGYQDYNTSSNAYGGGFGANTGGGYAQSANSWGQQPTATGDGGFGSYGQQQSYGGGPMRGGGNHYSQRSGPYSGGQ